MKKIDFSEAQATKKIDLATSHDADGEPSKHPVTVPLRPMGELVSQHVLVVDFVEGVPLNELPQTMKEKGIEPGNPKAKIDGRRTLESSSLAFRKMTFRAGFTHDDPHPGNIFIGDGGKVSLIDCGQFKALPRLQRVELAELVLAVRDHQNADQEELLGSKKRLANLVCKFGVKVTEGEEQDANLWCSVALFSFGDANQTLPGGHSSNELADDSPIKLVTSFPQEFVLLGCATVLLNAIAKKLDVPHSLASKRAESCLLTVDAVSNPTLPSCRGKECNPVIGSMKGHDKTNDKVCFKQVTKTLKDWGKGKKSRFLERTVKKLPLKLETKVLECKLKQEEKKDTAGE